MNDFFHMGGYAFYVWTSYGIATAVLVANLIAPVVQRRKLLADFERRARRGLSVGSESLWPSQHGRERLGVDRRWVRSPLRAGGRVRSARSRRERPARRPRGLLAVPWFHPAGHASERALPKAPLPSRARSRSDG